jgi:aerobic carbon-monoxide dehydrogenase medium subunit
MKPPPFAYHRPESRQAVDRLLAEHGDEAKILAGGQSLIPILNMRLGAPARLVDINGLAGEPAEPVLDDGAIRFSPLVRQAAVEHWPQLAAHAPAIAQALSYTAHPAIRSRGTVVGSVAHADPSAELPAAVLALDGEIRCRSVSGARTVPAREFFVGALETALEPGEWVDEVSVPARRDGTGYAVEEFARRHGDYALCGVVALAGAFSFVGMGATPVRFVGDVREAVEQLEPEDDIHATAEYRRHLALRLAERVVKRA